MLHTCIILVVSTGIEPVSRVPETHVVSILLRDLNYFANIILFYPFPVDSRHINDVKNKIAMFLVLW